MRPCSQKIFVRSASVTSFIETRDEAILQIETIISNYASKGYCRAQDYWWIRALDGDTSRFVIEGAWSDPPSLAGLDAVENFQEGLLE